MSSPTIYALASGRGRAGIAVIRLSGPDSISTVQKLSGKKLAPRRAVATALYDPTGGEHLDDALCIAFPAPASFTGEDVAEIQVHGGPAVIQGVLNVLGREPALRMSAPGEFTRRAFEAGKMDLTAAESIADLIDAETEAQRRQALRQHGGALAGVCDGWRDELIAALAHWEAAIDFSDEELPGDLEAATAVSIERLRGEIEAVLADAQAGERLREGIYLAIIGPPNAGKSSLLNLLARRDVAIVAETAGTTRDVIEVHLDLGGYPVIAADTAGLRETNEVVEREGVRRARARAETADLRLAVFDTTQWPPASDALKAVCGGETIIVANKSDLLDCPSPMEWEGAPVFLVSVETGAGIDDLLIALTQAVADGFDEVAAPVVTRARHREALNECMGNLVDFLARPDKLAHPEIGGEDLRLAARALGRVTGRVDVEDLLDVIFSDFCIGK